MSVGRKVFHCVVDDSALTVNISEIKKWTSQGAITLIVPLYTLERLRALKKAGSQIGMNAREAVRFLDRVTSGKHNIPASKIVLQGPMERFATWEEVERFFLPEYQEEVQKTPVDAGNNNAEVKSMENENGVRQQVEGLNEMSQMLLSKLNFKKEPEVTSVHSGGTRSFPTSPLSGSSRASPEFSNSHLEESVSTVEDDEPNAQYVIPPVPNAIKPLLNSILWRLHAQPESSTSPSRCILVTNDRNNQNWAQKFGITVKTVPQLRTSIIYEEKEFKNHCKYLEKNAAATQAAEPKTLLSYEDESDEDVLVFVPRGHAKSRSDGKSPRPETRKPTGPRATRATNGHANGNARSKDITTAEPSVEVPTVPIDPDSFSRNIGPLKQQQKPPGLVNTGGMNRGSPGNVPRVGGGRRGGPRGGMSRGGSTRGRGKLWVP